MHIKRQAPRDAARPQTSTKFIPSALQPNFVAEKSNQIWSDVASQKSQQLQQPPKDYL